MQNKCLSILHAHELNLNDAVISVSGRRDGKTAAARLAAARNSLGGNPLPWHPVPVEPVEELRTILRIDA